VGAVTFYEQRVLPHLVNWSMRQPTFKEYRSRLLQSANGCVLEIGIGSGRAADLIAWYDARGTSENWIKELKIDLHADRLSCHRFRANAFRLQLHSLALLLLAYFRRAVLAGTRLASATIGTIRLQLLKVAGRVVRGVRRLWFHLASHWPGQPLFTTCHHALARAPARTFFRSNESSQRAMALSQTHS
jgi:SAM-dependent methyltransferase